MNVQFAKAYNAPPTGQAESWPPTGMSPTGPPAEAGQLRPNNTDGCRPIPSQKIHHLPPMAVAASRTSSTVKFLNPRGHGTKGMEPAVRRWSQRTCPRAQHTAGSRGLPGHAGLVFPRLARCGMNHPQHARAAPSPLLPLPPVPRWAATLATAASAPPACWRGFAGGRGACEPAAEHSLTADDVGAALQPYELWRK